MLRGPRAAVGRPGSRNDRPTRILLTGYQPSPVRPLIASRTTGVVVFPATMASDRTYSPAGRSAGKVDRVAHGMRRDVRQRPP